MESQNQPASGSVHHLEHPHRIRNFRERIPPTRDGVGAVMPIVGMTAATITTTEFYTPDDIASATVVFLTCLQNMTTTPETDRHTILGMYGSAMACFLPELKPQIITVLKDNGYAVAEIKLPSEALVNAITMNPAEPFNKCLVLIGQLCLLPYKNISELNYENFISSRISALKAHAGVSSDDTLLKAVNTVKKAVEIREAYGANLEFKQALLYKLLNLSRTTGMIGTVCAYITQIIAWTDMTAATFVSDMLLKSKSPVLSDRSVASEVRNLYEALVLVDKHPLPQFFRILAPLHEQKKLDRSRFPILSAVAQRLKMEESPAASNFVSTMSVDSALVQRLITLHHQASNNVSPVAQNVIEYLTGGYDEPLD